MSRIEFSNPDGIRIVTTIDGKANIIPNLEPLVDENWEFTGLLGVYSKSGFPVKECRWFMRKYRRDYKYIFLSSNGPYFASHYKVLYRKYDAVTSLDCGLIHDKKRFKNNLELSYSMYTRCAPSINGFFYEQCDDIIEDEQFDFSILTWYGDRTAKVWPDARHVIVGLCEKGYKGIVVTQRGSREDILKDSDIKKFVDRGLLEVYNAEFDEISFFNVMRRTQIAIFPNQLDAFPKHLIECYLTNKPVVISPKLLFGVETLRKLGKAITMVHDFSSPDIVDAIASFIDAARTRPVKSEEIISPREAWLSKYDLQHLSRIWAEEINRVFHTNYERIYLMRHTNRYKDIANSWKI